MSHSNSKSLVAIVILGAVSRSSGPVIAADPSLHTAVSQNQLAVVRDLLDDGADIDRAGFNHGAPIFYARSIEIVQLLLEFGADLTVNWFGSPLESFAQQVHNDSEHREVWRGIVGKLLEAGAEYTIAAATYLEDLDRIREIAAHDDRYSNDRRAALTDSLRVAAQGGQVGFCHVLLENGADPNDFERHSFPVIVDAVAHPEVVKLLIDAGADLDRPITCRIDKSGLWIIGDNATAVHHAAERGISGSIVHLLDAGVDVNARDSEGQTALHIAVDMASTYEAVPAEWRPEAFEPGWYIHNIEVLLDRGASPHVKDDEGKSPLDLARELDLEPAIMRLLEPVRD